jgi:hypothetical protein
VWVLLLLSVVNTGAFSLLGPLEPWMSTNVYAAWGQLGGPMELNKSYRWNVPFVTYGFTPEFKTYYGTQGVAAVEAAAAVLNAIPPATDLAQTNDYPLFTGFWNPAAANQYLIDVKSEFVTMFLNCLGVGPPVRSVFVVNGTFAATNPVPGTNYPLVMRNFDPLTGEPTDVVNGVQFSFDFIAVNGWLEAVEFSVDPLAIYNTAAGREGNNPGSVLTGLTHDDVAALRFLLAQEARRVEPLLPDVVPWPLLGSNGLPLMHTNFTVVAERPGVNKIELVRHDPGTGLLGRIYDDVYFADGTAHTQTVARLVSSPDILITTRDFGVETLTGPGGYRTYFAKYEDGPMIIAWTNCAALNGDPGGAGPGIMVPGTTLTLPQYGRYRSLNGAEAFNPPDYFFSYNFGVFDLSTNAPYEFGLLDKPPPISLYFAAQPSGENTLTTWSLLVRANAMYRVEASSNLVDWFPVSTNHNASGILRLQREPAESQLFYRASELPSDLSFP